MAICSLISKLASNSGHIFKSHSCPAVFEYLEDIDFDESFELSLFKTKSENTLDSLVPNPDFAAALEIERHNRLVDNFILRSLQSDIHATNLAEFVETISVHIGSTITAHEQSNPPFISVSPIITYPESTVGFPSKSHTTSPPHTPHTIATPTPPATPRPNLPKAMAARFAPLALPQNLQIGRAHV